MSPLEKNYGTLLNGKSTRDILAGFNRLIGPQADDSRASLDVNVPSTISLDQERGWKTPAFLTHLQKYNITPRFKTDKFQPNSLGSVDNAIKRIKQYIRRRITENEEDADSWTKYFDEAIEASNNRKFEVLSRMAPNEIFGQNGAPINENAEHTIFNLEIEQAEKWKRIKRSINV